MELWKMFNNKAPSSVFLLFSHFTRSLLILKMHSGLENCHWNHLYYNVDCFTFTCISLDLWVSMYILPIIISQQARIMLCYANVSTEPELELSCRVLHVKDHQPKIEKTVDLTASHFKWRVSSLCLLAPIIPESQKMKHHALVLIYKELNKYHKNKFVFHVFLASNNDSEIKVMKQNGPTSQ